MSQLTPDCLQVFGGEVGNRPVFGFVIVDWGKALHKVSQFCFGEESGVGEVEVVLLHAVVAACSLSVVAVLRHAELSYAFTMFAPVHYLK